MKLIKFLAPLVAIFVGILAIYFVLQSENALVVHPKGIIAESQLRLITTNILLMLVVVIPTFICLFFVVWKYRAKGNKKETDSETPRGAFRELLLWAIPLPIIAVMIGNTWYATHELDPYKPIDSESKPIVIQVVALDWKWLFIYPDEGIATLNFVVFPEKTPIAFSLTADGSPMNSFWIPQLSGQIYAMSGMVTPLHIMAHGLGEYRGKAVEINGEGYADMTFMAKSLSSQDFKDWVADVKKSSIQLTEPVYNGLVKPSIKSPVTLYSSVEKELFKKIVMKPMHPTLWKKHSSEN